MDSVVKAITYLSTSAATVTRVVHRAHVDVQHGNMGLTKSELERLDAYQRTFHIITIYVRSMQ